MSALHPRDVLFEAGATSADLPVCDHYAGLDKTMRKSLALQGETATARGPIFDLTLDCEDGAVAGHEREHAELVAELVTSAENRFGRVGARIHDVTHPAMRVEIDVLVQRAGTRLAYVMLPKARDARDVLTAIHAIDAAARAHHLGRALPVHVLIETHGALADVFAIAAMPRVESISFGLLDFVSAHRGAIADDAMRSPGQFEHPLIRRAKTEISAACHAHAKVPSHNVTTDFGSPALALVDAKRAIREFGFLRMWSIHPSQIAPIVEAFRPDAAAIDGACEVLLAGRAAQWGPTRVGTHLHDRASYRYYWQVLQRAARTGASIPHEAHHAFFEETDR